MLSLEEAVIPAKAGIQVFNMLFKEKFKDWIPAFAGMTTFYFLLRVVLGCVFVYASFYKIQSPGSFAHQIYNFKLLPSWAINPLAITIPWLQLFCGLGLIFNRGTKAASFLIFVMLIFFQGAVASALIRGLNISCGCFKSGGDPATWMTFARDFGLVLLAGVQYFCSSPREGPSTLAQDGERKSNQRG